MPRKQTLDAKPSPAMGKPVSPLSTPPAKSRKSSARNAATGDGAETAPKGTSLPGRKVGNRFKKAVEARPAPPMANPRESADGDGFREAVSRLAYHFWEVRASPQGSPDEDWARAEKAVQEVLEKLSLTST